MAVSRQSKREGQAAQEPPVPPGGWPKPRAAYIHIPFCRHHCGYCNFTVVAGRRDLQQAYVEALGIELLRLGEPQSVDSIYLGGGTPTDLPIELLESCLQGICKWLRLSEGGEFTIEANPEDVTPELLDCLARCGVNRLSLGIQSFRQEKLESLQRTHDPQRAVAAIELAAKTIPNVSIDLIFAAPNESLAQWEADLGIALQLPIRHLSAYALTYEKGAAFYGRLARGQLQEVDEEQQLAMFQATRPSLCGGWLGAVRSVQLRAAWI